MSMANQIRDPICRVQQSFETRAESLLVDNWLEPGGALPAHYHPQQEERWSVLGGQVRVRHRDHEHVIGRDAGEIVVAGGDIHGLRNDTDRDAHLRCYVTPPVRPQRFLRGRSRHRPAMAVQPARAAAKSEDFR